MQNERLFISDCHLHAERPELTDALINFLQVRAAKASHLYILGDLFEVWLGDDDPASALAPVIDILSRLAQGCEIYFMAGNRDFLIGADFAARVGLTLLTEPHPLQLGSTDVVLVHGDSLCTDDHDYQAFRSMVRKPQWQAEFLAKSLCERQQIAAQMRRDSVAATHLKASEIMDVNADAVADLFRKTRADVIIHGHTHRPAVHHYPADLSRIVLGDWGPKPSYLSWTETQGFRLSDPRVSQ
jgi:UDP-2,3-diacylglucosamine hydrolase